MKPVELNRPITVYWDLTPAPPASPDYLEICDQILALRPLQLQILDQRPELGETCRVLEKLKGAPLAVTLTASATAIARAGARLRDLRLHGLFLHVVKSSDLSEATYSFTETVPRPGVAFVVTTENWPQLPEVVRFCVTRGVPALTLPMHRFYHSKPLLLTAGEQEELQQLLAGIDCSNLLLTIHDPFLWRAFHPAVPFPGGGCQAGNTMVAIAPDGMVYPCPSLPSPLGSLTESSLVSLVTGAARKNMRAKLSALPEECRGCADESGCRGGCRGRSIVIRNSPESADPACRLSENWGVMTS